MTAAILLIGALVTGALVWLLVVHPPRAVAVLGIALLGAIAAYCVGFVVGCFQYSCLDGPTTGYVTTALGGAAIGASLGALIGIASARRLPPVPQTQAWVLRGFAVAALLTGWAARELEARLVAPGGIGERWNLAGLQHVTVADAVLVAAVLLAAAGWGRDLERSRSGDPRIVVTTGAIGVVFGIVAWTLVLVVTLTQPLGVQHAAYLRDQARQSARCLASAALRYDRVHGQFPPDVPTLLGGRDCVAPHTRIRGAGRTQRGYCIVVGADLGDGRAGPALESAQVRDGGVSTGSSACSLGEMGVTGSVAAVLTDVAARS